MQKLEENATYEQIIAKINEIVEQFQPKEASVGYEIAPNVKAYFDELGGNMR